MMVKMKTILIFVAVICTAAIGFIFLYNPETDIMANELQIDSEPVAMGPEVSFNSDLQLICEGEGSIEVTPYKSSYSDGEIVKFTARPLEGWVLDHWDGDISGGNISGNTFSAMMSGKEFKLVAVFVEK